MTNAHVSVNETLVNYWEQTHLITLGSKHFLKCVQHTVSVNGVIRYCAGHTITITQYKIHCFNHVAYKMHQEGY